MQLYLRDFFSTLTKRSQERASVLLEEAKVGKTDLDVIAQRLVAFQGFQPLLLTNATALQPIASQHFLMNFQDMAVQMDELFRVSNQVSLILDSHAAVLGAQIKAVEDDLLALEKMANNMTFLLAEGATYNYAYLESFTDDRNRETSFDFDIPDRASLVFGPAQNAIVKTDEGVLGLSSDTLDTHGISGQIIGGNATSFVVTDTGLANGLVQGSATGWRYTIAAPTPVAAPLPSARGRAGAQVLLEFYLAAPSPASEIKIVPFSDHPIEVVSVVAYASVHDAQGDELLEDYELIDRPLTLYFPMRTIAKFRVLLNQPVYDRAVDSVDQGEVEYRSLSDQVVSQTQFDPRFQYLPDLYKSKPGVQRLRAFVRVINFVRQQRGATVSSIPDQTFEKNFGPLRIADVLADDQSQTGNTNIWSGDDPVGNTVYNVFFSLTKGRLPNDMFHRLKGDQATVDGFDFIRVGRPVNVSGPDAIIPRPVPTQPRPWLTSDPIVVLPQQKAQPTAQFNYTYSLGFEFLGIGANAPGFKGVYVSKPLASDGDIGQIRVKTSESNFRSSAVIFDNNLLTSVEYSVSNSSRPMNETDWVPILPIGEEGFIESERFFPDATGQGFLRFPASRQANVNVYRNGLRLGIDATTAFIYDAMNQVIKGVKLPLGSTAPNDIFTVQYVPNGDFSLIDFQSAGFSDLPLITAHDASGTGEGFSGTGGRNQIDLGNTPYVDQAQVDATFNASTKVPLYQPITVQLQDGTVAVNGTNYGNGPQSPLQGPSDELLVYLQSGRTLIFNNTINQPFRVFYQYLQNNVRVRVVLRVNSQNFVTPKVDFYHAKARTRRAQTSKVLQ